MQSSVGQQERTNTNVRKGTTRLLPLGNVLKYLGGCCKQLPGMEKFGLQFRNTYLLLPQRTY